MIQSLKSIVLKGLVILLPLLLLYLALSEIIELLISIATPVADLFPKDAFEHINETGVLAALLLLGAALFLGLMAKIPAGRAIGSSIETRVLYKIPMYRMLKNLIGALLSLDNERSFKPALVESASGDMEPCYIIEDTGRSRVVVLLPWAPAAFAGSLKLVKRESVHELPASFDAFSVSITHLGTGLTDLIPEQEKPDQSAG